MEAWYMADEVGDQTAENRRNPNVQVSKEELDDLGVLSWHLPPAGYSYPAKAVPWDPNGTQDPALAKVRNSRGYNYADIITCSEECLPDYHNKLKAFFQEHIHSDEEVRYIVSGSGYFDVRDLQDKWIRIRLRAGDLIVLPEGIYHRFTMDEKNFTQAMRLFKGVPVWTPINRPADEHKSRAAYLENFGFLAEEQALRESVVGCLRTFFTMGWCLGSSGAIAARVGPGDRAPMLVTPSGVPKEQLVARDLFLLSANCSEELKIPSATMKVSDSAAVFGAIFAARPDVRAVTHIHSVAAVLAASQCESCLRVTDLEMIKGLGVASDDVLEVPVIPNMPREPELVPALKQALRSFPAAPAVLVRDHGLYVFGKTLEKAKIATECLGFVLDVVDRQPAKLLKAPRPVSSLDEHPAAKRARVAGPSLLLLDVEGTTTPISFVKDKLFPYAALGVGAWLAKAPAEDVKPVKDAFSDQCKADGVAFDGSDAAVERLTGEWIAKDRKVPALKDLQGRLWRAGYEKGELKGQMYDDTPLAMSRWANAGKRVAIFSSGSREAQRLIFQHSDKGDLTGLISAYFDPKTALAHKQDSKAYEEIALSLGIDPSDGLFCTDVLGEAQAAKKAGWNAVLTLRPGNAALPEGHGFPTVTSLLQIV